MGLKWLIPLGALLLAGCEREQWDDCITSAGPGRVEERTLATFTAIDLNDKVDLVFEHRASNTVAVEAGRNLLGQVETEVDGGTLYIRNGNRCNWVRSFKPRITVRVPVDQVETLTVRGTGNVRCTDTIIRPHFSLQQWSGVGTVHLLLDVGTLECGLHTGAGDAVLEGRCNGTADLFSGIMGPIDASRLRTRFVNVNNSGVADIRCWATVWLNAQISNVGDVYYRTETVNITSSISGTGRLIPFD